MKINVTGPGRNAPLRRTEKKARAGGGSAFASHLQETASAGTTTKAAPAGVNGLLALQEVRDDADETSSRAKAFAHGLLDQLDALRHSLLLGRIEPARLRELRGRLRAERVKVMDPELAGILDEIELRVAVELAKYEESF
ncbi:MAG: flagellar assembly protein FliX [Rhodospirillaceae bacterium]|nr:MAG: flagellar assembly protein FliX [Rhodospirillaceae bacterium]